MKWRKKNWLKSKGLAGDKRVGHSLFIKKYGKNLTFEYNFLKLRYSKFNGFLS